jgi:serine protease Do
MISRFLVGASEEWRAARRSSRAIRSALTAAACAAGVALAATGDAQAQRSPQPAANQSAANQSGGGSAPNLTQQVQSQVVVPLPSLSPLVDRVTPAVVNVSVVMSGRDVAENEPDGGGGGEGRPGFPPSPFDEFLRRFFEQQGMPFERQALPTNPQQTNPQQQQRPRSRADQATALGSGFIIDPSGYVVTNNHVVANAETDKVTVAFHDNSKHPAKIIGRDELTDVALLKIDAPQPLPFVAWGDSDAAKVGDWVVAVGNPFGLGGTVTAGIISARGRNIQAGPYDDFLQIDAAINRGNSGGPTFNLGGQVVGINTAIYSPSGGSVGIGFAVPASLARTVIDQIRQQGHVTRGWLGVQIQPITPEIAKGLGLDPNNPKGALVADVVPDSPAAKAGLKQGDVILRFADKEVKDAHDLPRLVAETPVGQKVEATVLRNGKEQPVQVAITELKDQPKLAATGGGREGMRPKRSSALGLQLAPLSDDVRERADVPKSVTGVIIVGVSPDSPAAGVVEPGDVIVSVNQQPVTDPAEAGDKLKEAAAQKQASVLVLLNHRGTNRFVGLPLEASGD